MATLALRDLRKSYGPVDVIKGVTSMSPTVSSSSSSAPPAAANPPCCA